MSDPANSIIIGKIGPFSPTWSQQIKIVIVIKL